MFRAVWIHTASTSYRIWNFPTINFIGVVDSYLFFFIPLALYRISQLYTHRHSTFMFIHGTFYICMHRRRMVIRDHSMNLTTGELFQIQCAPYHMWFEVHTKSTIERILIFPTLSNNVSRTHEIVMSLKLTFTISPIGWHNVMANHESVIFLIK